MFCIKKIFSIKIWWHFTPINSYNFTLFLNICILLVLKIFHEHENVFKFIFTIEPRIRISYEMWLRKKNEQNTYCVDRNISFRRILLLSHSSTWESVQFMALSIPFVKFTFEFLSDIPGCGFGKAGCNNRNDICVRTNCAW